MNVFCTYSVTLKVLYRSFLTIANLAGMQYSQLNLFPPKCRTNVKLCLKRIKLLKHSMSLKRWGAGGEEAEVSCPARNFRGQNNYIIFQSTSFPKSKTKYLQNHQALLLTKVCNFPQFSSYQCEIQYWILLLSALVLLPQAVNIHKLFREMLTKAAAAFSMGSKELYVT